MSAHAKREACLSGFADRFVLTLAGADGFCGTKRANLSTKRARMHCLLAGCTEFAGFRTHLAVAAKRADGEIAFAELMQGQMAQYLSGVGTAMVLVHNVATTEPQLERLHRSKVLDTQA